VNAKPTIFFLHVPKTAGFTLRELIRRQYGPQETFLAASRPGPGPKRAAFRQWLAEGGERPPDPILERLGEQLRRLNELSPERRSELRVVMGHLRYGIHEALPGPFTYLTMLRDPVDRVLSTYHHQVTRQGLAVSVEDYIRSERTSRIDNGQTRRLAAVVSGDAPPAAMTPAMFDSAVRNLREHFSVIGLTERFDLSVLAMARTFGWRKLGYVSYNVSRGRPRAQDLPADVVATIRRHNEYDLELLQIARALFDEQVAALGLDPEREVAAYRRRLRRYQRLRSARLRLRTAAARMGPPESRREARLREQRRV
jgi:hypothetical protein